MVRWLDLKKTHSKEVTILANIDKLDQINSANLLLMFWCLDMIWRRRKTKKEKEKNIWLAKEKEENNWKRKKILREENYLFFRKKRKTEKEKEKENIFFPEEKEKEENIWMRKIFRKGKYLVHRGEEAGRRKRRNHLEKENWWWHQPTDNQANIERSAFSKLEIGKKAEIFKIHSVELKAGNISK